jgi:hypothetical protein
VKVSGTIPGTADVLNAAWAPDSSRLGYRANILVVGEFDLYTVLPDGTGGVQVSAGLGAGSSVGSLQFTPDGAELLYAAVDGTAVVRLYRSPSNSSTGAVELSGTFPPGAGGVGLHDVP